MSTKFHYVYILISESDPDRHYTGLTDNVENRLKEHNAGECAHTSKFAPWRLDSYFAFSDRPKAVAFEQYLKSHSGRAFAKRHF